jgi:hypothetical protein
MRSANPTDAAERLRYVFVELPTCSKCGSRRLRTVRSIAQDDGTRERRTHCLTCALRFIVVAEYPPAGVQDLE